MDPDSMGNTLIIDPAAIYSIPFQPLRPPLAHSVPVSTTSLTTPTISTALSPSKNPLPTTQEKSSISSNPGQSGPSNFSPSKPLAHSHPSRITTGTSSSSASATIPMSSSPSSSLSSHYAKTLMSTSSPAPSATAPIQSSTPSQPPVYAQPVIVPSIPPAPKPVLQPRPQLRLHIMKRRPRSPRPCVKDDKDPMEPEMDMVNLRRLTVATLRRLGVIMAVEELPQVDVHHPLPIDSEQVLPGAAMQLITAMILGTSGDKEVSQTVGSQICNGDLVALQRMILAGLKSKSIATHTAQTATPLSSSSSSSPSISNLTSGTTNTPYASIHQQQHSMTPTDTSNDKIKKESIKTKENTTPKAIYDLSPVTYHTPTNVTRLFLRLYRFILNILLSTPDCWPFIQPVPASAVFYHQEIKYPMDLSTIEQNMWNGLYTHFAKFEQDMQLIWKNAKSFHRNAGAIPKHAENLEALFYKVVIDLKKQIRRPLPQGTTCDYKFDTSDSLPEESDLSHPPMKQMFSRRSIVFGISAISPLEPKAKKPKGLAYDKQLYIQLNGPFFHSVERMKQDPYGNHPPVPRFYIAKNRTLLRQVRAQGVLAIFYNTKTTRTGSKTHQVETDIVLAYPASPLFDIDQTDDFAPKGWIHLRPLRVLEKMEFSINETIERDYFRRMFATFKFMVVDDNKMTTTNSSNSNKNMTKRILKKMVQQILDLSDDEEEEEEDDDDGPVQTNEQQPTTYDQRQKNQKQKSASTTSHGVPTNAVSSENGHLSPTIMDLDMDDGADDDSIEKDLMDVDNWSEKSNCHQQSATMEMKDEKRDTYLSSTSLSTQRSTLSPDSMSSVVSPHSKALETVISTIPLSISRKSEMLHDVWKKLLNVCTSKGADVVNVQEKYGHLNWSSPDSEGFFKQVYFLEEVVVQTFRQMTMYQRITEVACLMKLRNLPHMAQLREVLYNDNGDITGLSMERYQTTLKHYTHAHSHHRLTAYQKYDIIYQMVECMKTIHEAGLAHRDLSEVNIMVNTIDGKLEDGTRKVCLYLIDFGKSVFCDARDLREWFVDIPRSAGEYDGDVVPETEEELKSWCDSLPWVKGKPDHGYRMYRSIQTLPKTRSDTQVLPYLIQPQAEDIYSIGVMIWKVFTETEPWRGILDTDLQGLRYVAEDDYRIQRALEHEIHGELSRQLLLKCLRTLPLERDSAADILDWLAQDDIREGLLTEWKMYSSETRATRKVKTMYGFDGNGGATSIDDSKRTTKKTKRGGGSGNHNSKSRGRMKKSGDV
ncbi:unnamed protein product [Absidia cylindrospora]